MALSEANGLMVDTGRNLLATLVRKNSICAQTSGISGSSLCRNLRLRDTAVGVVTSNL